jgi:dTDP-4-dehydrorhamnose reductase
MRILVTGASGLLGLNFCLTFTDVHQITGVTNSKRLKDAPFQTVTSDLSSPGSIKRLISDHLPQLVIHCAAMANVDACEKQPDQAMRINAGIPGELAAVCRKKNIKLVYISTDAVFDGLRGDYSEDDEPHPLSVYAASKLAGEEAVRKNHPQALIARVNFYGFSISGSRSLAEFFLDRLSSGQPINGFVDVMFCPLYVLDLAEVLMQMVNKDLSGLYHVVSPENLSKYSFGVAIAKKFGFDSGLIQPISVAESGLTAKRSPRLDLNVEKLLGEKIKLPNQAQGLERFYLDYRAGLPEKIKKLAG